MALHDREFLSELYIEHIEEAAFLYETRVVWLEDSEIGWLDIESIDERFEAHIDALIVGGDVAKRMCYRMLDDAEPSSLNVFLRVLFRHRDAAFLAELWKSFDYSDGEKARSVADAFKWECPAEWSANLAQVFTGDRRNLFPLLAPCIAYRFREHGQSIASALDRANSHDQSVLLSSLAMCERNSLQNGPSMSERYSIEGEIGARSAVILCGLVRGDRSALQVLQREVVAMPRLAAIAGGSAMSRLLLDAAKSTTDSPEVIFGLGLSGNLAAVPLLLSLLDDEQFAEPAAEALNLICGANLYEDVHVPDDVDEDELFEQEKEAFRQGELPKNINDLPYGSEFSCITLDKEKWIEWIQKNKQQFKKGLRYRSGRIFTASALVGSLIDNRSSYRIRKSSYEELVIRYALDIQFAADDLVEKQKQQLNLINRWAIEIDGRLEAGRWYFDGVVDGSH